MIDFATLSPAAWIIIGSLLIYNIIVFVMYGVDKASAKTSRRRTPEKKLLLLALLGGSPGALLGMSVFRHKTRKGSFQFWIALILLAQVGVVYGVLYWLGVV